MPHQASNVSPIHAVVALIVLALVTTLAVFLLEPKSKEDPFAKSEELRLVLERFPEDVRQSIIKEINIRDDRYDQLPYDRLDRLVNLLQDEPDRLTSLTGEPRSKRVEKVLEQIDMRDAIPPELQGVGITEKIGAQLPLNLVFRDENNRKVPLGSFFQSGLPVILTLNYSDCPQLCHLQLNEFVEVLRKNKIIPGQGFEVVTVSINPDESPNRAKNARKNYLIDLGAPSARWHFLTCPDNENIIELAKSVGYGYRFDPVRKDYAHASTLIFCSPGGVVTTYYQGIEYTADELRRKLADAAAGIQTASGAGENYFNCKVYDGTKPYALSAAKVMKIAGVTGAVLLALVLTVLWMIPSKKPDVLPPLQGDKHV